MNLSEMHRKLIAAARSNPPAETVPYAFEKRIMARLENARTEDAWGLWGRALWRGAFACAALSAVLSLWTLQVNGNEPQDLESTMTAAAEQLVDSW